MKTLTALALASTMWVGGMSTAALAEPSVKTTAITAEKAGGQAKPGDISAWAAPLDDLRPRQVALFGLLPVTANEGVLDRAVRVALGAGLAYVSYADPLAWGLTGRVATGVAAGVMGWTAFTGTCPLYLPIGLNTRMGAEQ